MIEKNINIAFHYSLLQLFVKDMSRKPSTPKELLDLNDNLQEYEEEKLVLCEVDVDKGNILSNE